MFKGNIPQGNPRPTPESGTHNRYFDLRSEGPSVPKGRVPCCHAVVAGARPGACRLTRAGVPAASTRRCMRETWAAPPAAPQPPSPQRQAALSQTSARPGGLQARGDTGTALRSRNLGHPGSRGSAGSASRPVRCSARRASRSLALPGSFWFPHTFPLRRRVRAERHAARRLPPWRGARGAAAAPGPPASGKQPARPARDTPAEPAPTPRASEPRGWRGPPDGRFRPPPRFQ